MTMLPDRRSILAGGAASLIALPSHAAAASRTFRVTRAGSDIGIHRVNVTRQGSDVRAQTDIDIAVKFLGITAYRYEMSYPEIYRNGMLQSFDATSNADGDRGYVKAMRSGDLLEIDGSGYSGTAPGTSVPTSYWRMNGLGVSPWISTQSGKLFAVKATEIAPPPEAAAGSRAWNVTDNGEYTVKVWYDPGRDWTGCSFDAGGELGVYTQMPGNSSLAAFAS